MYHVQNICTVTKVECIMIHWHSRKILCAELLELEAREIQIFSASQQCGKASSLYEYVNVPAFHFTRTE